MKDIYLPLHHGKAPYWLLNRMKRLAEPIVKLIIVEYGEREFFRRISDPIFFQSFSNVLGFDWNSSGSTTVLTGVLKSVLNKEEFEVRVAGGKGSSALRAPEEIQKYSEEIGADPEKLIKFSRIAAKTDGAALIDGYSIYHHAVFFSPRYFTVVQQGMNEKEKLARRYHWEVYRSIPKIEEVHSGIVAERQEKEVVNMVSRLSRNARDVCVDLVRDGSFKRDYRKLLSISKFRGGLYIPRRIDWKAVEKAYNLQPKNFEELILVKGIGRETVRALALISDLIYNVNYDREDPAKYCFAVGGKDGVPFPVRKQTYDEVIEFMREVVKQTELGNVEKRNLMRNLQKMVSRHGGSD